MQMVTAIALGLVSLLAGFSGSADWKVVLAFAAIAQCLMASLETGRSAFIRFALFVFLLAAVTAFFPLNEFESAFPWFSARSVTWASYLVSILVFLVATFNDTPAPSSVPGASGDTTKPSRYTAGKSRAISSRITSG